MEMLWRKRMDLVFLKENGFDENNTWFSVIILYNIFVQPHYPQMGTGA